MDMSCGASNGLFLIFPTSIFVRHRVMVSLPIEFSFPLLCLALLLLSSLVFVISCVWLLSSYRAWLLVRLLYRASLWLIATRRCFLPPIELGFCAVTRRALALRVIRLQGQVRDKLGAQNRPHRAPLRRDFSKSNHSFKTGSRKGFRQI